MNAETQRRRVSCFSLCLCVSAFIIFSSLHLSSQNWSWINVISGNGELDLSSLTVDSQDNTYLSGTFTNSFSIQNKNNQSFGLADNYLMKLDAMGDIEWVIAGGSEGNDTDGGICIDTEDALYWVGGFWLTGRYDDLQFNSTKSSKSLFIIKYDAHGAVVWTKLIEGSNAKNSSPPITDQENNVYLTGSFSDTLFIDNRKLIAQAREDIFVGKWNKEGQLIWLKNFGLEGLNRALELAITPSNEVIIGGNFKGKIALDADTITANTPDFDVFLAALDINGQPKWLRKAGGVLEDNFNSLALDEEDNCYVIGQYTGRLTLSEAIEITTEGFNENGFLLKYDKEGTPLWATSIGGTNFETTTDVLVHEEVLLSGNFENELSIGEQTINGEGVLDGYLLKSDFNGLPKDLVAISSNNLLLINQLDINSDKNAIIGGTFKGTANFNNSSYSSPDHFSIFIGASSEATTPNTNNLLPSLIKVYPNPASQSVRLETPFSSYIVQLWNSNGQKIYEATNPSSIPVAQFPVGTYLLEIIASPKNRYIEKLLIYR